MNSKKIISILIIVVVLYFGYKFWLRVQARLKREREQKNQAPAPNPNNTLGHPLNSEANQTWFDTSGALLNQNVSFDYETGEDIIPEALARGGKSVIRCTPPDVYNPESQDCETPTDRAVYF